MTQELRMDENMDTMTNELKLEELDNVNGGAGVTAWTVITTAVSWGGKAVKAGWDLGKWAAKRF